MRILPVSLSINASAWWNSVSKRLIFCVHTSIFLLLCLDSISAVFPARFLLRVDTVGRRSRATFVLAFVEALVRLDGGAAVDHVFRSGFAAFIVILTAFRSCLCLWLPLAAWLIIGANFRSALRTIGAAFCCTVGDASVCTLGTCFDSWYIDLVCQWVITTLIVCSLYTVVVGLVVMDGFFDCHFRKLTEVFHFIASNAAPHALDVFGTICYCGHHFLFVVYDGFCGALVIELYSVCDPLAIDGLELTPVSVEVFCGSR